MSDSIDLSLATTPELIEELKRRHTALLIVTEEEPKVGSGGHVYAFVSKGSMATAMGLAEYVKLRMAERDDSVELD